MTVENDSRFGNGMDVCEGAVAAVLRALAVGLVSLCGALMVPSAVSAQPVTARVATESPIAGEQGRPVTVAVSVMNGADAPAELRDVVVPPGEWQVVAESEPYTIPPGAQAIRLITVVVPKAAVVDAYPVVVRVVGDRSGEAVAEVGYEVEVRPVYGLRLQTLRVPQYAVAGTPYETTFSVENEGNVEAVVALEGNGGGGYQIQIEADTVRLAPAERRVITVTAVSPDGAGGAERAPLRLRAELVGVDGDDIPSIRRSPRASATTLVLPELGTGRIGFHTFPMTIGVGAGAATSGTSGAGAAVLRVYGQGQGPLRQGSPTTFSFEATSPYLGASDAYAGSYDRYQMALTNPRYRVALGDGSYRPSVLSSQYGFGGLGYGQPGPFGIGAYYLTDRVGKSGEVDYGMEADLYADAGRARIGLNVLRNQGGVDRNATYAGVEGAYDLSDRGAADVEVGVSQEDETGASSLSAGVSARGRVGGVSLSGYARSRGDAFPGQRGEQSTAGASVRASVGPEWRLNLSGSTTGQSFALNGRSSAFRSVNVRGGVGYGSHVAVEGRVRDQTTDFATTRQRRTEAIGELTVRARTRQTRLELRGTGGVATSETGGAAREDVVWGMGGTATYAPSPRLDLSGTADVLQGRGLALPGAPAPRTYTAAATVTARPSTRLSVLASATATRSEGAFSTAFQAYRTQVTYRLPWGHELGATAEYSRFHFGSGVGEAAAYHVFTTYAVPLDIGIHRDRTSGAVRGQLTSAQTGEGVSGVPIVLRRAGTVYGGGLTATDGTYVLSNVAPGSYDLSADPGSVERGAIVREGEAVPVVVGAGEYTAANLTVVQAGGLRVRVEIVRPEDDATSPRVGADVTHGPAAGFVVAVVEADTLHGFTDADGTATFGGLRPGTYAVSLGARHAADFELTRPDSTFATVPPGEIADVVLTVRPRRRSVRMAGAAPLALSASSARSLADPMEDGSRGAVASRTDRDGNVYTIGPDDTLFGIARRLYGSGTLWRPLWRVNQEDVPNPHRIRIGNQLLVPRLYVVEPGDTLRRISTGAYGTPDRWMWIWGVNREVVPNPNLIRVGQQLLIPEGD